LTASAAQGLACQPREAGVEEVGHFVGSLEHFVRDYGAAAVTVILALEALGAPLPGETLLIFAAVLAGRGEMSLPALLIFAWAGSVLGDNIGYAIGRKLGCGAITRYGARVGLTASRFDAVERVFARYGAATVACARFVNVLRQLNGIVAGTLGMEWQRFLIFNALGAALWVALWVLGAFYLSEHISTVTRLAHRVGIVAAAMVAVALLASLVFLWRRRRGASRAPRR
jgi:membrane protein DedA with SNARE-associated domain